MKTFTLILACMITPLAAQATTQSASAQTEAAPARVLVERAVDRMGGEEKLRDIERVRYELVTQWQPTAFGELPERVSYELNTDVRDYTIDSWRNTRRFPAGGTWRPVVDLVRGDVAARDLGMGAGLEPLNIAYVDERDELFAYTPDRLILAALDAPSLRAGTDTLIDEIAHARIHVPVGTADGTLFLRRTDGLPTFVRFRAGAFNDFGLVPWGEMEVEVWYSVWRTYSTGATLPTQWDVRRVGRPYKRLSVLSAEFNPEIPADWFAIDDSLAEAYRRTSTRPMHDMPLDSARIIEGDFVSFGAFGAPAGAIRVGGEWLLLETGQAPLMLERALDWLARNVEGEARTALAGAVDAGYGGAAATARHGIVTWVGAGAWPYVERVLANHDRPASDARPLHVDRWITIGADSVRVERIDLPNAPASLIAWVPALRYVWAPDAVRPLDLELVREHAATRGWNAEWLGSRRALRQPTSAAPRP